MTDPESLPRRDRRAVRPRAEMFSTDDAAEHGIQVRVLRGSPTPEEIAAVTAVLSAAVVEEASHAEAVPTEGTSAWQRSQRTMRSSLTAGPGRWRSFSA